jgi:hypothetical protein
MLNHFKHTSTRTPLSFLSSTIIFVAFLFCILEVCVVEYALGETSFFDVVFQRQWGVVDAVGIPAIGIPPVDSTTTGGRRRRLESYLSVSYAIKDTVSVLYCAFHPGRHRYGVADRFVLVVSLKLSSSPTTFSQCPKCIPPRSTPLRGR